MSAGQLGWDSWEAMSSAVQVPLQRCRLNPLPTVHGCRMATAAHCPLLPNAHCCRMPTASECPLLPNVHCCQMPSVWFEIECDEAAGRGCDTHHGYCGHCAYS